MKLLSVVGVGFVSSEGDILLHWFQFPECILYLCSSNGMYLYEMGLFVWIAKPGIDMSKKENLVSNLKKNQPESCSEVY